MKNYLHRGLLISIALFVLFNFTAVKAQEYSSEIYILGCSDELIDCSGSLDRSIIVSATTSTGEEPTYQWYKDGDLLPGETSHILSFEPFDFTVSGTYTCEVMYNGAYPQFTTTIPVYALTAPSIIEQPNSIINAKLANEYSFGVKAHYRGLIPPYYKDYFQWYKYDAVKKDSVPVTNDSRIAGAKSSLLTIKNLKATDICKPGDFYFVRIEGQCGVIYSNPFVISQSPELVFRDHPENINPCPKADVVFMANAIAPKGFTVTYKWQKNGIDITDGVKFNGVNSNKLQVFGVESNDEGQYTCISTIPEVPTSKTSNAGKLTLKDIPTANAEGLTEITTKRGNNVTLSVILVKGAEPLTVKWYFKDELFKEGLWSQFDGNKLLTVDLEGVNENQSGLYKCVLENECDKTEVLFSLAVDKWEEANSVEVISENGYALYTNYPNPAKGNTTIRFEMPETNNALITLVDQSGRAVSELFNGVANKGMNALVIDTDALNIAGGVFFYMISANGFNASLPMIIVK